MLAHPGLAIASSCGVWPTAAPLSMYFVSHTLPFAVLCLHFGSFKDFLFSLHVLPFLLE